MAEDVIMHDMAGGHKSHSFNNAVIYIDFSTKTFLISRHFDCLYFSATAMIGARYFDEY